MGMDKNINDRDYALRVERLLEAVKELEDCAIEFPETRDRTVELLEKYSRAPAVRAGF